MGTVTPIKGDEAVAAKPEDRGDVEQAQKRFDEIRGLVRNAEAARIKAAIMLAAAHTEHEWTLLDLPDYSAYVQHLGIPQSTGSKMLKVGQVFGGLIPKLSAADLAELSIERLYVAAQMALNGMQVDDALADAVAHPTEWLIAKRDGSEPADSKPMMCPLCGDTHMCNGELDDPAF